MPYLKEFFENREFETFFGRVIYAAFLTIGIKLNIVKDYATEYNREFLDKTFNYRNKVSGVTKLQMLRTLKDQSHYEGLY